MWVNTIILRKPSLGEFGLVTKILRAKNGQKVDEFEPINISVITDIDEKWFVVFDTQSTTFLLVMFAYPDLITIFLVLHFFVILFLFLPLYLLLNR